MSTARKRKRWLIPVLIIAAITAVFLIYFANYYHADETALASLEDSETVQVHEIKNGWFFDGPSKTDAFIFYPGAKVESAAYAPLMRKIAKDGMDVFLINMPFNFALFGQDSAGDIISTYDYDNWYIGGHSLGGVAASNYAAANDEKLEGLVLLASYSTKDIDDDLKVLSVYGTDDGVLNRQKYAENAGNLPDDTTELVIKDGNHAKFGSYGAQAGDGKGEISADEQQSITAEKITEMADQ